MADFETAYFNKRAPARGSANEKAAIRQAQVEFCFLLLLPILSEVFITDFQRSGTAETNKRMYGGVNNKTSTAHHAKLDRETEELKHKVFLAMYLWD